VRILVINCGSATLKSALYEAAGGRLEQLAGSAVPWQGGHAATVQRALAGLPSRPVAIAHRVVHGCERFLAPVLIDDDVLRDLGVLVPLAPLHNAVSLAGVEATRGLGVPLVAVFDTAFFAELPARARRYALPEIPGVRRFGFHGWSHRSVAERYAVLAGVPEPTIVTLHLGSGCSAAAIRWGRPVDVSMGYSPLEGLVMSTRPGDVDPGVLLHLVQQGAGAETLAQLLNHESGLRAPRARVIAICSPEDAAARGNIDFLLPHREVRRRVPGRPRGRDGSGRLHGRSDTGRRRSGAGSVRHWRGPDWCSTRSAMRGGRRRYPPKAPG
jgi:acetate kinase